MPVAPGWQASECEVLPSMRHFKEKQREDSLRTSNVKLGGAAPTEKTNLAIIIEKCLEAPSPSGIQAGFDDSHVSKTMTIRSWLQPKTAQG